ncbi:MAG: hypothetical protein DWQ02_08715 [Bacteroidetes bacterium]|nr:MAG: hypothetical protein DWQ02_08715 [Bacteroidota bacterium]
MNDLILERAITEVLQPETELEKKLMEDPEFRKGLMWGKPRRGHPEGEVYKHIREVLDNIDQLNTSEEQRQQLRLIAFVHDTFKHIEDRSHPRNWNLHHSKIARRFMENWTDDEVVLDIIEMHDDVYHIWRFFHLYHNVEKGERRKARFLERIGDNLQLYALFFRCDTLTGDKDQRPLKWFEETML